MLSHVTLLIAGYAFMGGVLPALIWLYFLLKEDSRCPEPKPMIVMAFLAGMAAVPLAIPLENMACAHFLCDLHHPNSPTVLTWAIIEETLKYLAAAIFILWRHAVDEAPDYVIYMLTVALGFAALENALYLLHGPLGGGLYIAALENDNLRFVGSTLLHVLASSAIGFGFAFSYKKSRTTRIFAGSLGLILAVVLHTLFNTLILSGDNTEVLAAFFLVWCSAVVFFALFEILKYLRYRNKPKNAC